MRLNFRGPWGIHPSNEMFGYNRASNSIMAELKKLSGKDGFELCDEGGDVEIFLGVLFDSFDEYFDRHSDRYWAFTMWESTIIDPDIIRNLKIYFDGLIVPSKWCATIFRQNGYEGQIRILPLGATKDKWQFIKRDPKRLPFTVYWQGASLYDRKGGILALKVFNDLNLPDSQFIMKVNPLYADAKFPFDIKLDKSAIAKSLELICCYDGINDISVRTIGLTLSQADMNSLLAGADVSLYPSCCEGFGLLPLEHMQTGLPLIISDNSGMREYINAEYMIPIPCHEKCSSLGKEFGIDYAADEDKLKEAILWAYNNREASLEMGRRASEWVAAKWGYDRTAKGMIEMAKEIYQTEPKLEPAK